MDVLQLNKFEKMRTDIDGAYDYKLTEGDNTRWVTEYYWYSPSAPKWVWRSDPTGYSIRHEPKASVAVTMLAFGFMSFVTSFTFMTGHPIIGLIAMIPWLLSFWTSPFFGWARRKYVDIVHEDYVLTSDLGPPFGSHFSDMVLAWRKYRRAIALHPEGDFGKVVSEPELVRNISVLAHALHQIAEVKPENVNTDLFRSTINKCNAIVNDLEHLAGESTDLVALSRASSVQEQLKTVNFQDMVDHLQERNAQYKAIGMGTGDDDN